MHDSYQDQDQDQEYERPLPLPPPLPQDHVYTRCYCEENVFLLARTFLSGSWRKRESLGRLWDVFVVFVSNETKTVSSVDRVAAAAAATVWGCQDVTARDPEFGNIYVHRNWFAREPFFLRVAQIN